MWAREYISYFSCTFMLCLCSDCTKTTLIVRSGILYLQFSLFRPRMMFNTFFSSKAVLLSINKTIQFHPFWKFMCLQTLYKWVHNLNFFMLFSFVCYCKELQKKSRKTMSPLTCLTVSFFYNLNIKQKNQSYKRYSQ